MRRDGPAGRRAALAGLGLDVWEVVETLRNGGNHVGRTARYHRIPEAAVRAAMAGEAAHRPEVAGRIRAERALAERIAATPAPAGAHAGRALLDRPIAPVVAERLRALGVDAVAAGEDPAAADLDDAALFAHAAREGRALVSQNAGDHLPLAEAASRDGDGHAGLILAAPGRYPRSPLVIDRLVRDLDAALSGAGPDPGSGGAVRRLEPPPGCPFWPSG